MTDSKTLVHWKELWESKGVSPCPTILPLTPFQEFKCVRLGNFVVVTKAVRRKDMGREKGSG